MDFIFEAIRTAWGYRVLLAAAAIAAVAVIAVVETVRWVRRRGGGVS